MKSGLDDLTKSETLEVIWKSFELRPWRAPVPEEYKIKEREGIE